VISPLPAPPPPPKPENSAHDTESVNAHISAKVTVA